MSREYYVLSLKWSRGEYLTWWGPRDCGYVHSLDDAGRYTQEQIDTSPDYYDNGLETCAVLCEDAEAHVRRVVSDDHRRAFESAAAGIRDQRHRAKFSGAQ